MPLLRCPCCGATDMFDTEKKQEAWEAVIEAAVALFENDPWQDEFTALQKAVEALQEARDE